MSYAWGEDADDPDSFRSSTNVFQGALIGVAVVGMGALAIVIAGET
jgi:hypothetical protein